jgi:hypothetical protein
VFGRRSRTLEKKTEKYEQDVARLDDFQHVPARHTYSVAHMKLFVSLILSASASFRCASHALALFLPYLPLSLSLSSPSWVCGRLWLLRLGYYKLTRTKEIADDWVWIVDHSIQLGMEKCLVILGLRLSCLPEPFRSLRYEDMEPIEVLPVKKSNGEMVYQQLEEAISRTGVPRQIVADEGSDLKKGVVKFCQTHSETIFTYDIKHKTATVLKHELGEDEDWKTFSRLAAQTKQKVQQTSLAFLSPRKQRTKSRYMNVDILIEWGQNALHFLEHHQVTKEGYRDNDSEVEGEPLMEKVGWVREFREQLKEWGEMMNIVETTEHVVRTKGLYRGAERELEKYLVDMGHTGRTKKVRGELLEFVAEEASKSNPDERLIGSSEVLESVFGKLKDLEGDQAKSGFTGLLLSIPAMVSRTTREVIQNAMERVSTKKVLDWCKEHIGRSLQAQRREAFKFQDKTEQKWDQLIGAG